MRCAVLVSCAVSSLAYHASQPWVTLPSDDNVPNLQLHRTGTPVPIGWRAGAIKEAPARTQKTVAQMTEEQKGSEVRIIYVHPTMVSEYRRFGYGGLPLQGFERLRVTGIKEHGTPHGPKWEAKYGEHKRKWEGMTKRLSQKKAACWGKNTPDGDCEEEEPDTDGDGNGGPLATRHVDGDEADGDEVDYTAGVGTIDWGTPEDKDKATRADPRDDEGKTDWDKIDWSGGASKVDWTGKDSFEKDKKKKKSKDPRKTGISRCGFTWDDAAAKMGAWCDKDGGCMEQQTEKDAYWHGHNYSCYADLPNNGLTVGGRECDAVDGTASNQWCTAFCNDASTFCDPLICDCEFDDGLNDTDVFGNEDAYDVNAPIAEHAPDIDPEKMLKRTDKLIHAVESHGKAQPSGLPACTWRPDGHWEGMAPVWTNNGWTAGGVPVGCTNATQYECILGENRGHCSSENWFDKVDQGQVCQASCVHTSLLRPAPYYALWYPGPIAKDYRLGEKQPRHDRMLRQTRRPGSARQSGLTEPPYRAALPSGPRTFRLEAPSRSRCCGPLGPHSRGPAAPATLGPQQRSPGASSRRRPRPQPPTLPTASGPTRYDHDAKKISLRARGVNLRKSDVLMSQVHSEYVVSTQ